MLDGEPAGIIGLVRESWFGRFFSEHKEALEPYLKHYAVMRALKAAMKFVEEYPTDVYAVATRKESHTIIPRLGFEATDDKDIYVWAI